MANSIRVEFLYDKLDDKTTAYVWQAMSIVDKVHVDGQMSEFVKTKIIEEMNKKHLKAKK